MTQHHHPTTPADTPAPPADGGDDDALNVEIARLIGYQWRLGGCPGFECRFLSPPDTHEGRETVGVNYPAYTMDEVFPLATEADKICRDWNRHVPRFASDPAAAFGLLAHVLAIRDTDGLPHFEVVIEQGVGIDSWHVTFHGWKDELRKNPRADANTLERAIALASCDALLALAKAAGEAGEE